MLDPLSFFPRRLALILFLFSLSTCWADLATDTIYLTWQRNPSTTMTIQWITPRNQQDSLVYYQSKQPYAEWQEARGIEIKIRPMARYLIHRVELRNLQPETEYIFRVFPYNQVYAFRTAPLTLEKEIRFVVGGDMYHDGMQFVAKTCQQAARTNPLFALIGGDIAYAVRSARLPFQSIERWIQWIKIWHATMVTPQGHMIPVIAAIGNHDLIGEFGQTPAQATVFSTLFPMPGPQIYNVLDFNHYLSLFILDSGHANPIDGTQTRWLQRALSTRQQTLHRLAIYHVPAYPSIRNPYKSSSPLIRYCWVPLFESGGIQAVFEHHDHAYKRTYPLLKNQYHPQGIVYLGDGAWGVETPRFPRKRPLPPYIARFFSMRHFIAVTLTPHAQFFKSINDQGQVIDGNWSVPSQTRGLNVKVLYPDVKFK